MSTPQYTMETIVELHLYHCIDCLHGNLLAQDTSCGCADEAIAEVAEKAKDDRVLAEVWAEHIAWAIKEYAE